LPGVVELGRANISKCCTWIPTTEFHVFLHYQNENFAMFLDVSKLVHTFKVIGILEILYPTC